MADQYNVNVKTASWISIYYMIHLLSVHYGVGYQQATDGCSQLVFDIEDRAHRTLYWLGPVSNYLSLEKSVRLNNMYSL